MFACLWVFLIMYVMYCFSGVINDYNNKTVRVQSQTHNTNLILMLWSN